MGNPEQDNNRRLLVTIGYIPPAEVDETFYAKLDALEIVAEYLNNSPSDKYEAVHNASP